MAELKFDMPNSKSNIIKVIGVGGGGSNAVNHMVSQGIIGVDFAVCNTDIQALENSPVSNKIHLGPLLTEGRGAGSRPEVGKEACIESIEEVRRFLEDNTKMLFITAGMGGGTGTGAAPIIAKAAREMDILTVGIVTLPFKFEGGKRTRQAYEGREELKKNVDALVVISNDKLRQIYGNQKISDAFGSQCMVVAIDARQVEEKWLLHTHGGTKPTDIELFDWAQRMEELGAGEILFTSMDHDGTKAGFANEALAQMNDLVSIPVIASGGAGLMDDFYDTFTVGKADAGLAASIFHFNEIPIPELKQYLKDKGIPIRI